LRSAAAARFRALAIALLLALPAAAQKYEVSVVGIVPRFSGDLGSFIQDDARDDDTKLKGKNGVGLRLGLNTRGYYGHEIGYFDMRATMTANVIPAGASARETRQGRATIRMATYNFLMYMMPRGERIRPYLAFGLQAHDYRTPRIDEFNGIPTRNYGANYGAGVKLRLFPGVGIRFDFRQYLGGKPYELTPDDPAQFGGIYKMVEGSAGVVFQFR
jgi:hypothetical protein